MWHLMLRDGQTWSGFIYCLGFGVSVYMCVFGRFLLIVRKAPVALIETDYFLRLALKIIKS